MHKQPLLTLVFVCGFIFAACQLSLAETADTTEHTGGKDCRFCHSEDEPHEGNFGQDCSICHTPGDWEQLGFDHGLSRFPLIGLHTEIDCDSCHSQAPDKNKTRSCRDCHLDDEPHKQLLGEDCARCHNPNGWDLWQFDHNLRTSFPLQGVHAELECTACHTTPVSKTFHISQNCVDCHRKDEPHRGDFGFNCERCHQPTVFKDVKMPY